METGKSLKPRSIKSAPNFPGTIVFLLLRSPTGTYPLSCNSFPMASNPIVAQLLSDQAFNNPENAMVIPKTEIVDLDDHDALANNSVIPGVIDGSRSAIRDIGPSLFQASSIQKIRSYSLTPDRIEILVPSSNQRPWDPPEGFVCLQESFFLQARLWFPIPHLLVGYCARRRMAISQLTPSSIKDMVGLLLLSTKCQIKMNCWKFEELTSLSPHETAGFFQTKMKSARKIITGFPSQIRNWQNGYFFVRINDASIYRSDAKLFRSWATMIDKPVKLRGFPPNFIDEARRLQEAGVLEWKKIKSSCIKETITWIGREDWDLRFPSDAISSSIDPMTSRPSTSSAEDPHTSPVGKNKGKRVAASSLAHPAKRPALARSGEGSSIRRVNSFDFSFNGDGPLFRDEEKSLELFRKAGGYDRRLPSTDELRESTSFQNLATATAAISGYVGKVFFSYEKELYDADVKNKKLATKLKATEIELEESKVALGTAQSDLESSSKKIEEANHNAERLLIENSKLQAEIDELRREADVSSLNQEIDNVCDSLEQAREEGRREVHEMYRGTIARLKAYIGDYRRAFKTAVTYWQSKAVADVLRRLLDQGKALSEAGVAQFERRCQADAAIAEAEKIEELDFEDLVL